MRSSVELKHPPPLFKRGVSLRVRFIVLTALSLAMLIGDFYGHALTPLRAYVANTLRPVQAAFLWPGDVVHNVQQYFISLSKTQKENKQLQTQLKSNAIRLQQNEYLLSQNQYLRDLLSLAAQLPVPTLGAEILYEVNNPFTRTVVINRGANQGVQLGQPVLDRVGVIGQITRVFNAHAEVTLLSDKDHAIPVQVLRNGVRFIAYGRGHGNYLELGFVPVNADVAMNDILVTSGLDSIYPAGLKVARVVKIEKKANDIFKQVFCLPLTGVQEHRDLLVLLTKQPTAYFWKTPPRNAIR